MIKGPRETKGKSLGFKGGHCIKTGTGKRLEGRVVMLKEVETFKQKKGKGRKRVGRKRGGDLF